MHARLHSDETSARGRVSTGIMPEHDLVQSRLDEAYRRFGDVCDGSLADYIPALAGVSTDLFGLCVAGVSGLVCTAGDCDREFSIQSISKPFLFALICKEIGCAEARRRIGVNSTGLPFDSVMAIELNSQRTVNPMVNSGAIATASLVPGDTLEQRWRFVREGLSAFAGRALSLDEAVYECEARTNHRNRGVAQLLRSYGRIDGDVDEAIDLYTRQCAISVTVKDLAVMGATLADGGVNPMTRERVVDPGCCSRVLAVLATAGLYEQSGDWLYEVGLPGKSGVSGGIVTIAPGKGGLATFAPLLDDAGNSVRGQLATRFLSDELGLNLFASAPEERHDRRSGR
jgi:glutaminase